VKKFNVERDPLAALAALAAVLTVGMRLGGL